MNQTGRVAKFVVAILVACCSAVFAGLSPSNIAVIVNSNPQCKYQPSDPFTVSESAGMYYCDVSGVPRSHIIEVNTTPNDLLYPFQYSDLVAQIRDGLVNQLGVDPADPANDPIQALVICYGVPYTIAGTVGDLTAEPTSVDSYLTLLFNANPDLGPDQVDGDTNYPGVCDGPRGMANPYSGKNIDFAAFRASTDNDVTYTDSLSVVHHCKLRYLVTRIDSPAENMVSVAGYGSIPKDVKALIDRSADSSGKTGKFVLDEPWRGDFRDYRGYGTYNGFEDGLLALTDPITSNPPAVVHDRYQSSVYLNTPTAPMFNTPETAVMGYASYGMHDVDILINTSWGRPYFYWQSGAIASVSESFFASRIRDGYYEYDGWDPSSPTILRDRASLEVTASYSGSDYQNIPFEKPLTNYRARLISQADRLVLATALVGTDGVARIDLSQISWRDIDTATEVRLYYPDDDHGYADGRDLLWSHGFECNSANGYDLRSLSDQGKGLALKITGGRQRLPEYFHAVGATDAAVLHSGVSGIGGVVYEAASGGAGVMFQRYAAGYSWAETAYMEEPRLAFKSLYLGDPLMAPYSTPPHVEIDLPPSSTYSGTMLLAADATPHGPGHTIDRVEFRLTDSSGNSTMVSTSRHIGSLYVYPFDTTTMTDLSYTLRVTAYEADQAHEHAEASAEICIENTMSPTTTEVTSPASDDAVLNGTVTVSASPSAPSYVWGVDYWLVSAEGAYRLEGTPTLDYGLTVDTTSYPNGVYDLYGVAFWSDGVMDGCAGSPPRRVLLANGYTYYGRVGGSLSARSPDPNISEPARYEVALTGKPVTAVFTSGTDKEFYIEEPDRVSGVRVFYTGNASIAAGKLVTLTGTVRNNAVTGEREIAASYVWVGTDAPEVTPLGLAGNSIGGAAPVSEPDTNGLSDGSGLYNIGLLIRSWGRVNYVGDDYVYINDGSGAYDGNGLYEPIEVPLDGSDIPTTSPLVKGVRVFYGDLAKPGIGDYIGVTGISGTMAIGGSVTREIRVRSTADTTCFYGYQRCAKTYFGLYKTPPPDLTELPVGSKVRLVDAYVYDVGQTSFGVTHTESWIYPITMYSEIMGATQLVEDQCVTITGTVAEGEYGTLRIVADAVYLGGSEFGAMRAEQSAATIQEDASVDAESLAASSEPGTVGWALTQPDGTVIDLLDEHIKPSSIDGLRFQLREWSSQNAELTLVTSSPVVGVNDASVDIIGATLTTLPDGTRALIDPQHVYVYTNETGDPIPPLPWMKPGSEDSLPWPWKRPLFP